MYLKTLPIRTITSRDSLVRCFEGTVKVANIEPVLRKKKWNLS